MLAELPVPVVLALRLYAHWAPIYVWKVSVAVSIVRGREHLAHGARLLCCFELQLGIFDSVSLLCNFLEQSRHTSLLY